MDKFNPPYYRQGRTETITFIENKGLNFNRGNVIKYTVRAGSKSGTSELDDLLKARWYLNREIAAVRRATKEVPYEDSDDSTHGSITISGE